MNKKIKAILTLDESVSWQSCVNDKNKSSSPTPCPDKKIQTFQWASVALWMMQMPLTEALGLAKEMSSM